MISVVIPFLDELDNLRTLESRLLPVLKGLGTYEVIFVDDGSTDGSDRAVLEMRARDPAIKLLRLSRNFGHQAALSAGLDHVTGECIALMDADLQDPPELLPEFVQWWEEGYEVVYAVRRRRQGSILKRAAYFLFYGLLRGNADTKVPMG